MVAEIARAPEREDGGPVGLPATNSRQPGQGGRGPVAAFLPQAGARRRGGRSAGRTPRRRFARSIRLPRRWSSASSRKFASSRPTTKSTLPTATSAAACSCSTLDTFAFKRGWGAYGKPLADISIDEADHALHAERPDAQATSSAT